MKTKEMLKAHPAEPLIDSQLLADCINACFECSQCCTSCADACLSHEVTDDLRDCIRACFDCADISSVTGLVLSRLTEATSDMIKTQVEACLAACRECAAECEKHADSHQHCAICAESCRGCEQACIAVLDAVGTVV